MEYLILNEESIPFSSVNSARSYLSVFFAVNQLAQQENFLTVRVSNNFDSGWYNLPVAPSYTIRQWISGLGKEHELLLKSLIEKTQSPQIPLTDVAIQNIQSLSEFSLDGSEIATPSLGATFLCDQLAVSFNSAQHWNNSLILLNRLTMDENTCDIVNSNCSVRNITTENHWNLHFQSITAERQANCRKGSHLWNTRVTQFPYLEFVGKTSQQLTSLSCSDAVYNCLWRNLTALNNSISNSGSLNELKNLTTLDITPESSSVDNEPKLKRHRMFQIPDVGRTYFTLHVKNFPAAIRLHLYPDYDNNKIYIGYFGKHLPTKRDR